MTNATATVVETAAVAVGAGITGEAAPAKPTRKRQRSANKGDIAAAIASAAARTADVGAAEAVAAVEPAPVAVAAGGEGVPAPAKSAGIVESIEAAADQLIAVAGQAASNDAAMAALNEGRKGTSATLIQLAMDVANEAVWTKAVISAKARMCGNVDGVAVAMKLRENKRVPGQYTLPSSYVVMCSEVTYSVENHVSLVDDKDPTKPAGLAEVRRRNAAHRKAVMISQALPIEKAFLKAEEQLAKALAFIQATKATLAKEGGRLADHLDAVETELLSDAGNACELYSESRESALSKVEVAK